MTDDSIKLLSVSQAAKITGLSRGTIAKAMNAWSVSKGRIGLRFVQPEARRLVRKQALLDWMVSSERMSACGF